MQDVSSRNPPAGDSEGAPVLRARPLGWVVPLIVLALALVWRLLGITEPQIWRDEAVTVFHTQTAWWDLLTRLPFAEDSPPLSFLLFKAWAVLFHSEIGLRMLPVFMGLATVATLMRVGEMVRPGSGWTVGLVTAFSHPLVHYSQEIRTYCFMMLATAAALWAAEHAVRKQMSLRSLFVLCLLAATLAHLHAVGVFASPMLAVYLLVRLGPRGWKWRPVMFAGCLWGVLILPMVWFNLHWAAIHRQAEWWVPSAHSDWGWRVLYELSGLTSIDIWGDVTRWTEYDKWIAFALERVLIAAPVILACIGLANAQTRRGVLAFAAAGGTYAALSVVSSACVLQAVIMRTMLPGLIPVLLAVGVGAAAPSGKRTTFIQRLLVVAFAATQAVTWMWMAWTPVIRRPPCAVACTWLRENTGPNDLFVAGSNWIEDLLVSAVGDRAAADQFFCEDYPVYDGRPPVPLFKPRIHDPNWAVRLRDALDEHRRRFGDHYTVWVVREGFPKMQSDAGSPEAVIRTDHEARVSFFRRNTRGYRSVVGYSPSRVASRPSRGP